MDSNRPLYIKIDLSAIPLCCPACARLTEWHDGTEETISHFHCLHCGAVIPTGVLAELLMPALDSISAQ